MSEDEQQPTFHVESHNQQGGITAGLIKIYQSDVKVSLTDTEHEEIDGSHLYKSLLVVQTRHPLTQIKVTAHAESIQSLDVIPQRTGMAREGWSGKREGYMFRTIFDVFGTYLIRVKTAQQDQVQLDLVEGSP